MASWSVPWCPRILHSCRLLPRIKGAVKIVAQATFILLPSFCESHTNTSRVTISKYVKVIVGSHTSSFMPPFSHLTSIEMELKRRFRQIETIQDLNSDIIGESRDIERSTKTNSTWHGMSSEPHNQNSAGLPSFSRH